MGMIKSEGSLREFILVRCKCGSCGIDLIHKCVFGITYSRCGQEYASFECLGAVQSQKLMIGMYVVAYAPEYVKN